MASSDFDIAIDISSINDDIKEFLNRFGYKYTHLIADDLYSKAELAISMFYVDYEPNRYIRHAGHYSMMNTYHKKTRNFGHMVYYGGIELSPEGMEDDYRSIYGPRVDKEFIYDLVYSGWHGQNIIDNFGNYRYVAQQMTPDPYSYIESRYNDILNDDYTTDMKQKARKYAVQHGNYKYLTFK